MSEMFHVVARSLSGGPDSYYRGPGTGLFNADKEWVGALMWDCAKKLTREQAEQIVADKAPALPGHRLDIVRA